MSIYGNDSLGLTISTQYLTVDDTSDTITLPTGTNAVSLYGTVDMWVYVGGSGETPTAAAPGSEKTSVKGIFLRAAEAVDRAITGGTDEKPIKIAAIRSSTSGTLYVEAIRI